MVADNSSVEIREQLLVLDEVIGNVVGLEEILDLFIRSTLSLIYRDFFNQIESKRVSR
jgi:hypothetical protein